MRSLQLIWVCVLGVHSLFGNLWWEAEGMEEVRPFLLCVGHLEVALGAVLRLMGKGFFLRYKESRFITTLSLRACSVPGSEGTLGPEGKGQVTPVGRPRALSSQFLGPQFRTVGDEWSCAGRPARMEEVRRAYCTVCVMILVLQY